MMQIPIQALPNQQFTLVLDNNNWNIKLKSTAGIISVSLGLNGVQLLDGARAVAAGWIIPSRYEESGNFLFITQNFQLPDYTKFNISQYLVYASPDDLAALRAPGALPITAADFNPIAALPLRFSPQGYV